MHTLFDILAEMVGYPVARLVLPLVSFGRIYVEPVFSPRQKFSMFGYRRDENGRIELEAQGASFMKRPRGRPRRQGPPPWEAYGYTKSTYYRRKRRGLLPRRKK